MSLYKYHDKVIQAWSKNLTHVIDENCVCIILAKRYNQ